MMSNNGSRTFVVVIAAVAAVLLCGAMLAGGYVLGRQSVAVAEPASGSVEIAETVNDMPAETELQPDVAVEAAPTVAAPAGDSAAAQPPAATTVPTLPPQLERSSDQFTEEDLAILWEAWQYIQTEFDGEIPAGTDLGYSAIQGVLGALGDQFTRFAPPDVAQRAREDLLGSFEGIGAFVQETEEGLTEIARPIDGGPAEAAGLKAGDLIVGVDGESVLGQTLDEVVSRIRGPQGTDVTLTIARPGLDEPFDVTITRQRIEIPIVESEMLDNNIAYVRLTSFSSNAEEQLTAAVEELLAQNPAGLILDLRDNPGGYLDQSVAVADLFLPEGVVLYERSSTYDIDEAYRSDTGDIAESIPLVVLVNAGSASASEIVAGALQDNGRAILIGEVTFGKGSVQQSHTLSDGSELRVTIARWYTPNEKSISGEGITPDIEVPTPEDLGGENDTQLQRAIQFLLTGE